MVRSAGSSGAAASSGPTSVISVALKCLLKSASRSSNTTPQDSNVPNLSLPCIAMSTSNFSKSMLSRRKPIGLLAWYRNRYG